MHLTDHPPFYNGYAMSITTVFALPDAMSFAELIESYGHGVAAPLSAKNR